MNNDIIIEQKLKSIETELENIKKSLKETKKPALRTPLGIQFVKGAYRIFGIIDPLQKKLLKWSITEKNWYIVKHEFYSTTHLPVKKVTFRALEDGDIFCQLTFEYELPTSTFAYYMKYNNKGIFWCRDLIMSIVFSSKDIVYKVIKE